MKIHPITVAKTQALSLSICKKRLSAHERVHERAQAGMSAHERVSLVFFSKFEAWYSALFLCIRKFRENNFSLR